MSPEETATTAQDEALRSRERVRLLRERIVKALADPANTAREEVEAVYNILSALRGPDNDEVNEMDMMKIDFIIPLRHLCIGQVYRKAFGVLDSDALDHFDSEYVVQQGQALRSRYYAIPKGRAGHSAHWFSHATAAWHGVFTLYRAITDEQASV